MTLIILRFHFHVAYCVDLCICAKEQTQYYTIFHPVYPFYAFTYEALQVVLENMGTGLFISGEQGNQSLKMKVTENEGNFGEQRT